MNNFSKLGEMRGWFTETGRDRDVVLSSRVRISRNLAGFPFPEKLVLKDEETICGSIVNAFEGIETPSGLKKIRMADLTPVERLMLFEKKLISRDFSASGNKTVLAGNGNRVSCMINEKDHLQIASITGGFNLEKVFDEVRSMDSSLEKKVDYAVSLEFGYLSSMIKNSGTGMKASVMLHLPFLSRTALLDRAIKSSVSEGFSVKGYMGDDDSSLGDIYQISNEISLGQSEEQYLGSLRSITASLVEYERRARDQFYKSKSVEFEDIFYRAYGLLKHCRLLPLREAVRNLTDFRLGAIMGWTDVPLQRIDSLIILSQKAHIQYILDDEDETNSKVVDYTRSQLVKTYLELLK